MDDLELERRVARLERAVLLSSDTEAVRRLVYDYQRLCDGGWNGPSHADPDALAALFTPDGQYSIDPDRPPATGTTEVRAKFVRLQTSMPWIIHYATNPIVDFDSGEPDAAAIRVQGFACYGRDGEHIQAFGHYEGRAERTPRGWRFAEWTFRIAAFHAI